MSGPGFAFVLANRLRGSEAIRLVQLRHTKGVTAFDTDIAAAPLVPDAVDNLDATATDSDSASSPVCPERDGDQEESTLSPPARPVTTFPP